MQDVSLVDLLKAGVHFGHQVSRWHPKMRPYIFTARGGVYIIDLEKTNALMRKAQEFVRDLVAKDGVVLFVGTKRQAKSIVHEAALQLGMPYVVERWLGGTFTNFPTISKMTRRLTQLKEERASGKLERYTKKEQLVIGEDIARLEKLVGGIERMQRVPDAIVVVDVKQERTAVQEAQKVKIPVVAVVDTNVSPAGIDYPIPGNDDATKSIQIIVEALASAVEDGKRLGEERHLQEQAAATAAAAAAAEHAAETVAPKIAPVSGETPTESVT